jgi:hypothetical protein
MRRKRSEGESAPMTLGGALAAKVRLIVWCKVCGHRAEPAVAEQIASYGGDRRHRLGTAAALFGLR